MKPGDRCETWERKGSSRPRRRGGAWLALVLVLQAGCLHEASQTCGNGGVCPPGLLCVDTSATTADGQICAAGTCGNGRIDHGEDCDDGNNRSGDGCPADCTPACGDGVLDPGEICDDGNTDNGDGCSGDCRSLDGIFQVAPPSVSFAATEGDAPPAEVPVVVHLPYRGDSVLAGYAPGIPQPTWLAIEDGPVTPTTVGFRLRATDTLTVGQWSTMVRLLISHRGSTALEDFNLPVSFRVTACDLAVEAAPSTLSFTASTDDTVVPPQDVRVSFNGEDVTVGAVPGWATVVPRDPQTSQASFTVSVNRTSFPSGTRLSDDIEFRTTRGLVQRTTLVHVTYDIVAPPDLVIDAPRQLSFTAVWGDDLPPLQTVLATFSGTDVAVVSATSFLTATIPDPTTSPASVRVGVITTAFAPGTVMTGQVVLATTRGRSQRTTTIAVEYSVVAPPPLEIQIAPFALAFRAISRGAASPPKILTATFNGRATSVEFVPSWLTVSPLVATTSPATFTVSVNDTAFDPGTILSGDIRFESHFGGAHRETTVHVEYEVADRPEVQFVAPYVGVAGRAGTMHLRGRNFSSADAPLTVRIGDHDIGPVIADSDTQVSISYPALPAGRYPVTIVDPPGRAPMAPELVIVAPRALAYQAIDAPSPRRRLIYDPEREAIYGLNRLDQEIEHFAYVGGSWSVRPPHVVPLLMDIAMAPDGRSLTVLDRDAINEISLTDGLFAPVRRADNPHPLYGVCGEYFDQALPADSGKIFIVFNLARCSGSVGAYLYDVRDHSLGPMAYPTAWLYDGLAGASADGTRIYAGQANLSPAQPVLIFESLSNTVSSSNAQANLTRISVGGNASRVILQDTDVYSRSLTLLGYLPAHGAALVSRDSRRAFLYVEDTAGARLEIYDLEGPLQPGALYPLLTTVPLANSANGPAPFHPWVTMTTNLDDTVVFVSGDARLLVVPLN